MIFRCFINEKSLKAKILLILSGIKAIKMRLRKSTKRDRQIRKLLLSNFTHKKIAITSGGAIAIIKPLGLTHHTYVL